MLKRWKQSRRPADSPTSCGSYEDAIPSNDPSNAFEHHILGTIDTPVRASGAIKHSRSIVELEPVTDEVFERPLKRRRTDDIDDPNPSEPLPEYADVYDLHSVEDQAIVDEVEHISAVARKHNTIATIEDPFVKLKCYCSMLIWSHEEEKALPYIGMARRKKIAVVVCDKGQTPSDCAAELSEHCGLSFGVYDSSSKPSLAYWSELTTRDVIVIDSVSLLESLACGSLAIPQIHILVLDDANAVLKDSKHPMRSVMNEYYLITDTLSRPRVFAVLANRPKNFNDRASLEHILDATEYSRMEETSKKETTAIKPVEMVVFYEPNVNCTETTLLQRLHSFDPDETVFRSHFRNASLALNELGPCASDLIWRRALKEIDKLVPHVFSDEDDEDATDTLEGLLTRTKASIRNAIKNWVFAMPSLDASSRGYNVSSKLSKLIEILKACEPDGDSFRGVIFVQKRCIAFVLADIIRMLEYQLGFIRPMALSRHGSSLDSLNEADVLEGFKTGLYNLLISTKYGEDLDIAPATIVIRFDLFESQVSYAYCRARTRERQSHLVHMAERGNDIHRRILLQAAKLDRKLELWVNKVATSRNGAVPPYPLRETVNPYRSDSEDESDEDGNFVQDPTTSGRIYIQDALTVVYRYASNILQGRDAPMSPLFEIDAVEVAGGAKVNYICTVLLPPEAPIARVSGQPCQSPSHARRSACFQTCVELFNRGILDYRLFPRQNPLKEWNPLNHSIYGENGNMGRGLPSTFATQAQQNRPSGVGAYLRKQPDFWRNTLGTMRGCLYPLILAPVASVNDGEGNDYAPMAILTRMPLPPFAPINVFEAGVARKVDVINAAPVDVDDEKLRALQGYTLRIIRAIMNKPYACPLEKMCYFIAPLPVKWSLPNAEGAELPLPDIADQIRWDLVHLAAEKAMASLNSQDHDTLSTDLEDAVIQDRWVEFTRRYYAVRLRTDLSPLSKPDDSPREKGYENLLEYCKARRKGFPGIQNLNQPLVQVDRLPAVVNNLYPSTQTQPDSKRYPAKYLIPELCARSTISASAYRTSLLLPSLLRRLDDLLLVKELNAKFFDHSIVESHLHAAVSSPSATVEVDYERLELLGDAYLKYLASIYVFVTHPTRSEGSLHTIRQRIVSNKALLANASRTGMPQYIQSKPLTPKVWAPPNFHVPESTGAQRRVSTGGDQGKQGQLPQEPAVGASDADPEIRSQSVNDSGVDKITNTTMTNATTGAGEHPSVGKNEAKPDISTGGNDNAPNTNAPKPTNHVQKKRSQTEANIQMLGDKCVADVAEAIIGAAYITGGREVALKVTKALNIPVPHIDRWSDFGRRALAPPPEVTAKLRDGSVEQVEKIIGHKIKRPHLLAQALTHTSIQGNEMTCYERLEFIGDAILDFLVIRHIFYRNGTLSPGALTLLKGAMVSNVTLAAVCVSAGLHEHLHYESAALAASIRTYASELMRRQRMELELAAREHRSPGQYWNEVEPPKALSDVVESIIGAVFLSDSFSPIGAEAVFDKILKPFYDRYITLQTLSQHPTKILLELLQSKGCQNFELLREPITISQKSMVNCDVLVHDVVLARAMDTSAPLAARRACFFALDALEGDPGFMSRTCDCRGTGKKKGKATLMNIDEDEEMFVEGVLG